MLTASDLLTLPYTPDLTQAGIAYARRSLPHTYNRVGGDPIHRMRRIVSGKAVELAFRRYLGQQDIPFDILGATPFTDPDRYDVALGGRRCDIKSFQIFDKEKIQRARRDPEFLLRAAALVPSDQLASDSLNDSDLYIFAFVYALATQDEEELQRARAAGQPVYLIYPFPPAWAQPDPWRSLGSVVLKTDLAEVITLELGGQDRQRGFQTEAIHLLPRTRQNAMLDYYSLAYLHAPCRPEGQVGVHSQRSGQTLLISPEEWGNIWVYGMEIILAGYLARGEFRRRARDLPPNSRVLQYPRTRTQNKYLPVRRLRPLSDLLARVKEWEEYKKV
jgi:hypothetical protein